MKIVQKMAFGSDWGRFLWRDIPEGYKANAELSLQQSEYKNLWEKTKIQLDTLNDQTVLNGVAFEKKKFDSEGKILLSTQLATMLDESGNWGNMKTYPKTKFVMKKLTEMGLKINDPRDFIGKSLTIQKGVITLEGVPFTPSSKTNSGVVNLVDARVDDSVTKTEKTQPVVQEGDKTESTKNIKQEIEKKEEEKYIPKKEEAKKKLIPEDIQEKKSFEVKEEESENLTTQVLSESFLVENSTAAEEREKIEPIMKELKKTPEQIALLKQQLQNLNQDFSKTKAELQKALEGHFEKGKLKEKTPAEMELLIKDSNKYTQLYGQLQSRFEFCRVLEKQAKILKATIDIDALYDEGKGYKSRYDVKEKDVLDVETQDKTDFGKRYESAQQAIEALDEGVRLDNQGIFIEMKEGYERAHLIARAKEGMKDLAPVKTPNAKDYDKIVNETDGVKTLIEKARTHGVVNDMFEDGELETLLKQERRSSHMQVKENVEKAYKEFPDKYKGGNISDLTEKELEKDKKETSSLINIFSTGMTKHLNEEKYRTQDEQENSYWETKYLDQGTADNIEKLLLRKTQLNTSLKIATSFKNLLKNNKDFLAQGTSVGTDRKWLSLPAVGQFLKFEKLLNEAISPYRGDANLFQKDLERQYGKDDLISDVEISRKNAKLRMSMPDFETSGYDRVDQKVSIQGEKLQFEITEKTDSIDDNSEEGKGSPSVVATSTPVEGMHPVEEGDQGKVPTASENIRKKEDVEPLDTRTDISVLRPKEQKPSLSNDKRELTSSVDLIEDEVSLPRAMDAIEEFWDAAGIESVAADIQRYKLEKTLPLLSIFNDNGEPTLVYKNKKGETTPIYVENPQNILENLSYVLSIGSIKALNLFNNRALARIEKSTDNSNQVWLDILPELAEDVELVSSQENKVVFERTRREILSDGKKRTVKTEFTVKVSPDAEYEVTSIIARTGKEKLWTDRKDVSLSREELIRMFNGEELENVELVMTRKKGVLERISKLGGERLDDVLKLENEKFRPIEKIDEISWMTDTPTTYWFEAKHKKETIRLGISIHDPFEYIILDGITEMKSQKVEDVRTYIQKEVAKIDEMNEKEQENKSESKSLERE